MNRSEGQIMGGELDLVSSTRALTSPEFHRLANVPPEAQWFANLDSAQTRRAYQNDIQSFMAFVGIEKSGRVSDGGPGPCAGLAC
jgi:hypothetical protein